MKKIKSDPSVSVKELGFKIENELFKTLDDYMMRYEQEHKKKLESFISAK